MINNINLTKRIMRRVYAIWFLREAGPVLLGMPLSFGLTLWLTAREFFVAKIAENFVVSFHSGGVFSFIGSALYSAPLLPAAIVGLSFGISMILAWRLVRNLSRLSLVEII